MSHQPGITAANNTSHESSSRDTAGLASSRLLEDYVKGGDHAAFAELVRIYGPMVNGVCNRVVGNRHDSEDAFQATFLVLAQKAASIKNQDLLAAWLYRVAYQVSLKARARMIKQRAKEQSMCAAHDPMASEAKGWTELEPILDRELNLLSEKYRIPVLLCDLGGSTLKEAAQQLGWPESTLASRLKKARSMLASQLAKHGFTLSAGTLAVLFSQNAAWAAVPSALMASTVQTAGLISLGQAVPVGTASSNVVAIAQETIQSMLLVKLKIVAAAAALLVVGVVGLQSQAVEPPKPVAAIAAQPAAQAAITDGQERLATDVLRKCLEVQSRRNRLRAIVTDDIQQGGPLHRTLSHGVYLRCNHDFAISARVTVEGQDKSVLGNYYDVKQMVKDGRYVNIQDWEKYPKTKGLTATDPETVDDRVAAFLHTADFGAFLDGYVLGTGNDGSKKTSVDLMLEGSIAAYDPNSEVNGVKCYLVKSSTKFGEIAVWVSQTGFQVLQFDLIKSAGHLVGGRKRNYHTVAEEPPNQLGQPAIKWSAKLRDVTLTTVNGVEVPAKGTLQYTTEYQGGSPIIETHSVSRTEIELDDTGKYCDRLSIDLEDGARLTNFDHLTAGVDLIWKKGTAEKAPEDDLDLEPRPKPTATPGWIRWFLILNSLLFAVGFAWYYRQCSTPK